MEILKVDMHISANDIRARTLRLPKAVTNVLPTDTRKAQVVFNRLSPKGSTIAKIIHVKQFESIQGIR